jgi:rhodanese-related sulfurtransferase
MSFTCITPQEIHETMSRGGKVDLIDVRTPKEFGEVHATAARLVPLDTFDPKSFSAGDGTTIAVICKGGIRAKDAAARLVAAGVGSVVVVDGGTQAWVDAGLPVVRGRRTIGVDRQTRIAAGSMVAVFGLLAYLLSPGWALFAAAVGCGLVMAGITDICPLATLIAKMPWNSSKGCAQATCCAK